MEKKKITLKQIGLKNLVLLCGAGIALIFFSATDFFSLNQKKEENKTIQTDTQKEGTASLEETAAMDNYVDQMEKRVQNILKKVEGIGQVEVMITIKGSKEKIILKDSPYTQETTNETDSQGGSRINSSVKKEEDTVLIESGEGNSVPYIIKELEPEIEGVVVIAEGGDNTTVMNEIISAIDALFGVPAHKIKVMKMSVNGSGS